MRYDIAPESVDLIYLDPPFFTGKIQKGKWRPEAMEVSYEDSKRFWSEKADVMREKAPQWLRHIAIKRPDFASYLYYMMERLEACHKVLKKTGSIYLHCDYRASNYLKMVMDEIFGYENFRNEIIWYYHRWTAISGDFQRMHDTILRYSKTQDYMFQQLFEDYQETTLKYHKWEVDEKGRRYYVKRGRSIESYRVYLDEKGVKLSDVWELPQIGPIAKERVGYPTQKPEGLLTRIIRASSNEGDLVLDPFCGCGTTSIVASKLNRKFIGIDIDTSPREKGQLPTAFSVTKNRSHELFEQARYVTRDLSEVVEMDGRAFELWVNEFYKATKPQPDRGVDGITQDGTPIQSKVYEIKYAILSQFINDAKYHSKVPKPVKRILAVSQTGFDDSARKLKFEIETAEGIKVDLKTPHEMLELPTL
ncbi:MAG: DNA methyltransferase [bacterium]